MDGWSILESTDGDGPSRGQQTDRLGTVTLALEFALQHSPECLECLLLSQADLQRLRRECRYGALFVLDLLRQVSTT